MTMNLSLRNHRLMAFLPFLRIIILITSSNHVWSFVPLSTTSHRTASLSAAPLDTVEALLAKVSQPETPTAAVGHLFDQLLSYHQPDANFTALVGNYSVACTLPAHADERPVGGRWNARWTVLQAWQHILPPSSDNDKQADKDTPRPVAEVVNMIALRLFSLVTIHVLLRGPAYPLMDRPTGLSPRTVRAQFAPPRIVLARRWAMTIGPPSSVVLDTPYVDDRIRLGVGGTSGSRFVFVRTRNDVDDWRTLYHIRPVGQQTLVGGLMAGTAVGIWRTLVATVRPLQVAWAVTAMVTALMALLVGRSTGGIEVERPQKAQ